MWHFAIGLYLVELTPGSLRLTAIYQLISTLSIIIFGPLVGDWVDANPRLKGMCPRGGGGVLRYISDGHVRMRRNC